jgi:hypothetical protein
MLTTCVTAADVLVAYVALPLYTAVTVCDPTARAVVVHVATRVATGLLTQPGMLTPPSWKVTVPVGAGATGVIVAVKTTGCPQTEGLVADVRVVVEADSAWPMIPPETSDSAPAVRAAPTWRTTRMPRWRDALTDLTRRPRNAVNPGSALPFMALRLVQTTCSAVDLSWMRKDKTGAKQRVNSGEPPPGFRVKAARTGVICESPLDLEFI